PCGFALGGGVFRQLRQVPVPGGADRGDAPEGTVANDLPGGVDARRTAPLHADLDNAVGRTNRLDHLRALVDGQRHRLFEIDVLLSLDAGEQLIVVPVVGRGDDDSVDVLVVEDAA